MALSLKNSIDPDNLTFSPVDQSNWQDLVKLFESKGGPHNCWCMVWRKIDKSRNKASKWDKKEALRGYIDKQKPIGIIAYHSQEPIGWCSVAPRETYRNMSGDLSIDKVWSLVCFFIKRSYRGSRLYEKLIAQAASYAKEQGANYLEAYPVDPDSPSYLFMGFKPTFEKLGFVFRHKAGQRRNVMVKQL